MKLFFFLILFPGLLVTTSLTYGSSSFAIKRAFLVPFKSGNNFILLESTSDQKEQALAQAISNLRSVAEQLKHAGIATIEYSDAPKLEELKLDNIPSKDLEDFFFVAPTLIILKLKRSIHFTPCGFISPVQGEGPVNGTPKEIASALIQAHLQYEKS